MNCSICGLPKGNLVGSVLPQCLCGWQKPNPPATKREWVGLTEIEITNAWENMGNGLNKYTLFAKAIEAKRKEKHEVSQEPVAWVDDERGVVDFNSYVPEPGTPLYTHPPKREWVETTEKDVHECFMLTEFDYHVDFNRDPEQWCLAFAKELSDTLKQKNGYAEEKNT